MKQKWPAVEIPLPRPSTRLLGTSRFTEIQLRQFVRLARSASLRVVYFTVATGIASGLGYALGIAAAIGLSVMLRVTNARQTDAVSLPQCTEAKQPARPAAAAADRSLRLRPESGCTRKSEMAEPEMT